MSSKTTLQSICLKYSEVNHNEDDYSIGGGLAGEKFASRRHEDAKYDDGKLTLGEATQLFKKATGLQTDQVKDVIEYAVPNMEWHHAGKLPKRYGGGMKKTYFLNAKEICDLATNWDDYCQKLDLSNAAENKKTFEERKHSFLKENATRFERQSSMPSHPFYILTGREMNGKYGWFDSTYKSYNMPEYFSGWEFNNEAKWQEFLSIK